MSNEWEKDRRRKRFKNKKRKDNREYRGSKADRKRQQEEEYLNDLKELYYDWEELENFYNERESLRCHAESDRQEKK